MKIRKRKLFDRRKKTSESGQVALQITSMADIFTILLVFLLKGLASDALAIAPSSATRLPSAINTASLLEPALTVELSPSGVLVEREFISAFDSFEKPFQEKLAVERERQKLIAESNETVKNDGRVIILSDEKVPFSQLKLVLRILAQNGYSEVKFGVVKE